MTISSINAPSFVEVYIWRARNAFGQITNSGSGGIQGQKRNNPARTGHVSMLILHNNRKVYVSFWPKFHKNGTGELSESLENDQGPDKEKTKPDVIFKLFNMNMDSMLTNFDTIKPRIANGKSDEITWNWEAKKDEPVTANTHEGPYCKAHCASLVWALLKIGFHANHTKSLKNKAIDPDFFKKAKLDQGQLFWGFFDRSPWYKAFLTPYGVCIRLASIIEAFEGEKKETIKILDSTRVEKGTTDWEGLYLKALWSISMVALGTILGSPQKK